MIKFRTLNDATSNGNSKNDHNMLQLASLKTSIYGSFLPFCQQLMVTLCMVHCTVPGIVECPLQPSVSAARSIYYG